MTGSDLRTIREARGLSLDAMGRALGYSGRNVRQQMHRYETSDALPPQMILRLRVLGWYRPQKPAAL